MFFVASPVPEEHRMNAEAAPKASTEYLQEWTPIDNQEVLDKLAVLATLRYNGAVEGLGIVMRLQDVTQGEADASPAEYKKDMQAMVGFSRWYAWVDHVPPADAEDEEELAYVKQHSLTLGEKDNYWESQG